MRRLRLLVSLLVILGLFSGLLPAEPDDLAQKYPATLDWTETAGARTWVCEKEDVWRLSAFRYAFGDQLAVELGPSQVVFGHHERNVVWAAVFPDAPGTIARAPEGQGQNEKVTSVWLRFNPALVGALFPPNAITGPGDAAMVVWGKRLAAHKTVAVWQINNLPVIPWKKSIVIDLETSEGPRRFYSVDTEAGTVKYEDFFRSRSLPKVEPITPEFAQSAFDIIWDAFDKEYAMFAIKPQVDWNTLREQYRPRAAQARTNYEVGVVLAEMLAHLEDLHVYVSVRNEYIPGYSRPRPGNANWNVVQQIVGPVQDTRKNLAWGRAPDGIGYIVIDGLNAPEMPALFDQALESLADTKALILDLRYNGGGDEPMAMNVAGRFLDKPAVYSISQYRSGPAHTDLGPKLPRSFEPRGPWRYQAPVVALQGQRTFSSAESFALMLAQCPQVTTMGDRTAGSSANPRRVEAMGGIIANLPRWIDMDPAGKPIDAVGVPPEIPVEAAPEAFEGDDPVLKAALEEARKEGKAFAKKGGVTRGTTAGSPTVVAMNPPNGAKDVSPFLKELRVTFSEPMQDRFSWCGGGKNFPASPPGRGAYWLPDRRTCVLPVMLRPNWSYRLSLNLPDFQNFRSARGVPLDPVPYKFKTGGQ